MKLMFVIAVGNQENQFSLQILVVVDIFLSCERPSQFFIPCICLIDVYQNNYELCITNIIKWNKTKYVNKKIRIVLTLTFPQLNLAISQVYTKFQKIISVLSTKLKYFFVTVFTLQLHFNSEELYFCSLRNIRSLPLSVTRMYIHTQTQSDDRPTVSGFGSDSIYAYIHNYNLIAKYKILSL